MSGRQAAGIPAARHRHRMGNTGSTRRIGQGERTGGTAGNERLTAMTGAALLVLFAAEGVTILSVRGLLTLHFFIGMLLAGPVLLKISATCYRFARYYTGAGPYVRKGPPAPLLRLLGPVVVLTSCGVLGTGVMLAVAGPGARQWIFLHKAMFVLWFGAMTIHVLAYLPRLARLAAAAWPGREPGRSGPVPGRGRRGPYPDGRAAVAVRGSAARLALLAAALGAGLVLAMVTIHLAGPWQGHSPAGASRRQGVAGPAETGARSVSQDYRRLPGISGRGRLPDDATGREHLGEAVVRIHRLQPAAMPAAPQ